MAAEARTRTAPGAGAGGILFSDILVLLGDLTGSRLKERGVDGLLALHFFAALFAPCGTVFYDPVK